MASQSHGERSAYFPRGCCFLASVIGVVALAHCRVLGILWPCRWPQKCHISSESIKDHRKALAEVQQGLWVVWHSARLLPRPDIEQVLNVQVRARGKHKIDLGEGVRSTEKDLIMLVWHVTLVVCWYGAMACFNV